jgi:hypothetical protein
MASGGAGESRFLVDETDRVAKRIPRVKRALTPRPRLDRLFQILAAGGLGPSEHGFQIVHGKIIMNAFAIRSRVERIAVGARIEAGQDGAATMKVVPSGGDAKARLIEQLPVERGRSVDVRHRKDHAIETGAHSKKGVRSKAAPCA